MIEDENNKDSPEKEENFGDIADAEGLNSDADADIKTWDKTTADDSIEEVEIPLEDPKAAAKKAADEYLAEIEEEERQIARYQDTSLLGDLRKVFNSPLSLLILLLAVSIALLFYTEFHKLQKDQELSRLIGYVKLHHEKPDWYQGELPEELKQIIHEYEVKHEIEHEQLTLIHADPKASEPIMGDYYPEELNNDDLILIIESQNIGSVSKAGPSKTELMNLSGLDLRKINYRHFNNFVGSNLRYTKFDEIDERELKFRGASIDYASFVHSKIIKANFTRARASYCNFFGSILDGSTFEELESDNAQFSDSIIKKANFKKSVILHSNFAHANLKGSNARGADFEGSNFEQANLEDVDFTNAVLIGASFHNANLRNVNFSGAKLDAANLEGADITGAIFTNADVNQTNFKNCKGANLEQIESTKFSLGALNFPSYAKPARKSYRERFTAPVEVY